MSDESHNVRLDRVETEVGVIRSELGGIKTEMGRVQSDVKGLGAILSRIEQGVLRAQEKNEEREAAAKPNLVAVISVLITIIGMLIAGAWLIGGQLSRQDERSVWIQRTIDRNEQRIWGIKGDSRAPGKEEVHHQ